METRRPQDTPPRDLVHLGYLKMEYVEKLREHKIRAWIDKRYPINGKWDTWVSPWLIEILDTYRKFSKNGKKFAGMTEIEFIVNAIPETDQS